MSIEKALIKVDMYRPNVAAFIVDENNKFLFCHRSDVDSQLEGFQVPQGGIEKGESQEEALSRELEEEIGLKSYKILGKLNSPIRYKWNMGELNKGSPYVGQEQTYFLVSINSSEKKQIIKTEDFDFYRWVDIDVIFKEIIDFKKPVYRQAYAELQHLMSYLYI